MKPTCAAFRVIAHVFYHDDAVDLVDAGIDGFAHLVRDKVMDDALIATMVKRGTYVDGQPVVSATQHLRIGAAVAGRRRSDDAAIVRVGERAGARPHARVLCEA